MSLLLIIKVFSNSSDLVMRKRVLTASLFLLAAMLFQGTAHAAETVVTDTGTTSWMLTSTALVLLMIPGLAMFYGGLVRSKNVLGTIMHCYIAMGIISILWVIVGYSMCFGRNV